MLPTRGFGIVPSTTLHNPTPQETTNQDSPDIGREGTSLSIPGSSVVENPEYEGARFETPTGGETKGLTVPHRFKLNHLQKNRRRRKNRGKPRPAR